MGNNCCECNNRYIDDENMLSNNIECNPKMQEEKNKITKITSCDTKINLIENQDKNTIPNLLEIHQNNSNNTTQNFYEQNIPTNQALLPNKTIPDIIINSAKKLKLIILQSKFLDEGKEYIINAGGLIGSPRKAKDGITYFGDKSVS
jgi:hypothetical protein